MLEGRNARTNEGTTNSVELVEDEFHGSEAVCASEKVSVFIGVGNTPNAASKANSHESPDMGPVTPMLALSRPVKSIGRIACHS
jgi:hypothetical protein